MAMTIATLVTALVVVPSTVDASHGGSAGSADQQAERVLLLEGTGLPVSAERVEYFRRVRGEFGFETSLSGMQAIIDEYGIHDEHGYPLSPTELEEVSRRIEIQALFSNDIMDGLESLQGFAGFYFDHKRDGQPTLLSTQPDNDTSVARALVPEQVRDGLVVNEAEFTYRELQRAVRLITSSSATHLSVVGAGIDERANRIEIEVKNPAMVDEAAAEVERLSHVDYVVRIGDSQPGETCTRSNCHTPMRAGISANGGNSTWNVGVLHNGDKQMLGSGHDSTTVWSHPGYGTVGSVAENEYFNGGIDAKVMYAPDTQVSNRIYRTSTTYRSVIGYKYPVVGLYVCLNAIKTVSCGHVTDSYQEYTLGGVSVHGGQADYVSTNGDSGGPVYEPIGTTQAYIVGIHSAGGGEREFARIRDVVVDMNLFILTS